MADLQAMMNWMYQQKERGVTYSMANRYGPNSYDCSSAVYYALRAGGFVGAGVMGNTDTLFTDLPNAGFTVTTQANATRGDVFLWGRKDSASGNFGHTGIFIDNANVIHCSSSGNGIVVANYQAVVNSTRNKTATIYKNPASGTSDKTPSFATNEQKVVYSIWYVLKKYGYTDQAIAGIVGNSVAECDLNPDLSEVGGCGYGLWQWTGNRYPLDGVAAACGAQYTINLMNKAGITGNYKEAHIQSILLEWTMFNGQWIGRYEPTTVAGFKAITNVEQATIAFMRNYERPGIERLQVRLDGANEWYPFIQALSAGSTGSGNGEQEYIDESSGYEELTNVGDLEELGINKGKIFAIGWHFSSNMPLEYIEWWDAENNVRVGRVQVDLVEREDIAELYPNVIGVEKSGFNITFETPDGMTIYLKGIRSDGTKTEGLIFDKVITFEKAYDADVETYAETNVHFFFEILQNGKVVKRGNKLLNDLSWTNELMYVPETEITLPLHYDKYFKTRADVKIYINNKVFHGRTISVPERNTERATITIRLAHVINEWNNRQINTNLAAKNRRVNDIYSTLDFRHPGWNMNFLQDSSNRKIDYVYSRQTKLEGLTKTCELTTDLFWRVGFNAGRTVDIGTFGEEKPYRISMAKSGVRNIRMIEEPVIEEDYETVCNIATVFGEKSDSGMTSMGLRDLYDQPGGQIKGFPVVVLKNGINNERDYDYIEFTKLAPNVELEYSVIDEESIALEGGEALERTFSFNDLAPFAVNDEAISDEDRAKAAMTAYEEAIRTLKNSRRRYVISVRTEEIPHDLTVGNKVRLIYDTSELIIGSCSNYMSKLLEMDDWYYITRIEYDFDASGVETNTLTLEKYLVIDREITAG